MINARSSPRLRTIVVSVCAVILTWLVVSQSLGAYLANAAPQTSLWIDPRQPEALVNLADQAISSANVPQTNADPAGEASQKAGNAPFSAGNTKVKRDGSIQALVSAFAAFETIGPNQSVSRPMAPDNAPAVRTWATTALRNDPLNARALRILGQLAEADGDDSGASKFMHAAAQVSLHQNYANYWLMRKSLQEQDYKSAIGYADVLLRTTPQSDVYVVPALAKISEDKTGAALMKTVLARNPPWRQQFFSLLPNYVTDARTPLDLMFALRNDAVPLTTQDTRAYVYFLIAHKFYSLAYYAWLQFLPAQDLRQVGLLYNGNFDIPVSGLPFDWTIIPGAGVTIDVVPRPDKKDSGALLVDFQFGRVAYHSVRELVMLTPGSYEFSGEYYGKLLGPRGVKWRIVCADTGATTNGGESPMITGVTKEWTKLGFTFTVPDKGCVGQYVRLDLEARTASEELISGSILFGNLRISRVATASTQGGKS